MKKNKVKYAVTISAVLLTAVVAGHYWYRQVDTTDEINVPPRFSVAATIYPLYDIVRLVAGPEVEVQLLLPPDRLLSEISTLEAADVSNARAVFAFGHALDDSVFTQDSVDIIHIVDSDIELLLSDDETGSPYYWLSLKNAPQIAKNIADVLAEIDSPRAVEYYRRAEQFAAQASLIDNLARQLFADAPKKKFVAYGYDWGYFARDYGLEIVHFTPAVSDTVLPSSELEEMNSTVEKNGLGAAVSDVRLSPTPLLPLMDGRNFSIINLDATGGIEDRLTYLDLMRYNARALFDALSA